MAAYSFVNKLEGKDKEFGFDLGVKVSRRKSDDYNKI